jgi:hypothetical protein
VSFQRLFFTEKQDVCQIILDKLAQFLYKPHQSVRKVKVLFMQTHKMKGVEVNKILYHYLEDYARDLKSYQQFCVNQRRSTFVAYQAQNRGRRWFVFRLVACLLLIVERAL